jgi:hypothetical protein
MNDMYFSFGIVALFLYSVFVASILRFVGVGNSQTAGLVGAIIIAHPYLTEIFTFRMALFNLSIALIFSIIVLESLIKNSTSMYARALALLATIAMLFTYQVFLNYFAVAIIFAFIYGQIIKNRDDNNFYNKAIVLTVISSISTVIFLTIMWLAKVIGLAQSTGRAGTIAFDEIPKRIEQISTAFKNIYWNGEPIYSFGLKTVVFLLLVVSILIILWHLVTIKNRESLIKKVFFVFVAFLLLIPVSLGVIIAFKDWWPVPRVIAHVAIITGLIFLLADVCIQDLNNRYLPLILFVLRSIVLIGFVLTSNQILTDQQRINEWDKLMANRIVSRLEMLPSFANIKFIHVNGGTWGYPAKLGTIQGDMNISALSVPFSKAVLFSEISGYDFKSATGAKASIGEAYCADKHFWPHSESITINDDLAIICLKK